MGYRSDVAYIIRIGSVKDAKDFVALVRLQPTIREALQECVMDIGEDGVVEFQFFTEDVKWYTGYEDVDMHERLLEFVRESFCDKAGYRFIRLGEDNDDTYISDDGLHDLCPWESLYVERSISMSRTHRPIELDDLTNYQSGENNG